MEVKICGVCTPADAELVAAAGADYLGVILAPNRLRTRTLAQAGSVFEAAPSVRRVGVFIDPAAGALLHAAAVLALDVVQLHGNEPPALLERVRAASAVRIWKAVSISDAAQLPARAAPYCALIDGLLVDGASSQGSGGVGASFPWSGVAQYRAALPVALRFIAAGGLTPANVNAAIAALHPDVVDVSSGVEREPGRKAADLIHAFVAAARGLATPTD